MKNFGPVFEERSRIAYEYEQNQGKDQIGINYHRNRKLFLRLMVEEKAQEKVFRPIQDRVTKGFCSLIPGVYQLEINNQLNLGISAKTSAWVCHERVYPSISYGTWKKMSFLLRLAIVKQLSKKEPQVMILMRASGILNFMCVIEGMHPL